VRSDFDVEGYEIEGLLGAGPTGETWLARENTSGVHVALHRVQPRDARAVDAARRLVDRLAALNHPRVRRIHELIPYDDELVFVLDHVEGGSLEQLLLVRGTLDPGEVVTTGAVVAEALAAAHERGLVHGDLRPEDILFTPDGSPLVTDIGFGRIAAPVEGFENRPYADPAEPPGSDPTPAGDVYSLAAICYTALTGLIPRPGQQRPVHQVAPGVPPGLAHAIQAGLQEAWDMRPHMAQFGALLDSAAQRTPVRLPEGMAQAESPRPYSPEAVMDPWQPEPAKPSEPTFPYEPTPPSDAGTREPSRGETADEATPDDAVHHESGRPAEPPPAPYVAPPMPAADSSRAPQPTRFAPVPGPREGVPLRRATGPGDGGPERIEYTSSEYGSPPRPPIALIAGVLVVVLAVVAAIVVWRMVGGEPAEPTAKDTPRPKSTPTTPSPKPTPTPSLTGEFTIRWWKNFLLFEERRADAFAHNDPDLLTKLYIPDSPAYKKDSQYMVELARQGAESVIGLKRYITVFRTDRQDSTSAVFEVERQLQPYMVVMSNGERRVCPGGQKERWMVEIVPLEGSTAWRIDREWPIGPSPGPEVKVCKPGSS
jgi:serine/threonine protein kinase